jgi:hypothetical protein
MVTPVSRQVTDAVCVPLIAPAVAPGGAVRTPPRIVTLWKRVRADGQPWSTVDGHHVTTLLVAQAWLLVFKLGKSDF